MYLYLSRSHQSTNLEEGGQLTRVIQFSHTVPILQRAPLSIQSSTRVRVNTITAVVLVHVTNE